MIGNCPAPPPNAGIVQGLLDTVDCNIRQVVQGGYEALFGPASPVAAVITTLLTLYVALLGFRLLTGRTDLKVADLPMIALKLGAIVLLTTSWASYQSVVFAVLFDGPAEMANQLLSAMPPPPGQAGTDIFARLQFTFDQLTQAAAALAETADPGSAAAAGAGATPPAAGLVLQAAPGTDPNALQNFQPIIQMRSALQGGPAFGATALWLSAVILLVSTLGLLLLAKLMLGLLLAVGPLFVGMLLFETTKGLFEGWLRTALGFALAPLATVVFMAGLLASLDPSLRGLAEARAAETYEIGPVLTILVLVLTFTVVFASVISLCMRVVAGFRLPPPAQRPVEIPPLPQGMGAGFASTAADAAPPSRALRLAASLGGGAADADRRAASLAGSVAAAATLIDRRTEVTAGGDGLRAAPVDRLGQSYRRRAGPARTRQGAGPAGLRSGGLS
jgi:type IV secretion system protein VirB6